MVLVTKLNEWRGKKTHLPLEVYFGAFNEISGISAVRFSFQCIMDICHAIGNMSKGQPYLNLREILCKNIEVDLDLVEIESS